MENVETPSLNIPQEKSLSLIKAIEEVIRKASYNNGLAIGIKEATRAIENRDVYFCVLAENCDVKEYSELVENLCLQSKVDVIIVPDKKKLGEWAGLNKKAMGFMERKKFQCACLAVKSFGEESEAFKVVMNACKKGAPKVIKVGGGKKE